MRAHSLVTLLFLVLLPRPGTAQDRRLAERLDSPTAARVQQVVDSARRVGLPTEPLVQKALEGSTLGASDDRIIAAVETLHGQLGRGREALGASASGAEITAAAGALRAGLAPSALRRLQSLRAGRPLVVPIAVLTDLVAEGMPAEEATESVLDLARDGRPDDEFMALRRRSGAGGPIIPERGRQPLQPAADPPVSR